METPKLHKMSERAVTLLKTMDVMEFLQFGATAIRDLGVYDIDTWGNGFETVYSITFGILFDENRNLRSKFYPIVEELRSNSSCGADPQMLAASLGRIAFTLTFVSVATERNS